MPFIAITERAAARLVNEQFDVLERGAQVHERLERLVIEGGGLDEILASTGGARSAAPRSSSTRPAASSRATRGAAASTATRRTRSPTEIAAHSDNGAPAAFAPAATRSPSGRWRARPRAPGRRPGRLARRDLRARRRWATSSACAPARRRSSSGSS